MLPNNKPYIIAETAFHHEGDIQFLKELNEEICKLNIDAVKFHLMFDITDYMIASHSAVEVINKISIPEGNWLEILKQIDNKGKGIILLTNDIASLQWVNSIQKIYPIEAIELHSTGLNDIFLLKECLNFNKTVILGVGGSTFDEIQYAVDFLRSNGKSDILLMHGFQNYPTKYEDINFKRMKFLQDAFNLPVGYADHTDPNDEKNKLISVLPQTLGFNILEKHITHVFGEKRIDAQAAVSTEMMKEIIEYAFAAYKTLGNNVYQFSEAEKNYGNTGPMKKAMVARTKILKGEEISLDKIAFKRTESSSSLLQKDIPKLIGAKASQDIEQDSILSFSNVEYQFRKENFDQFFVSNKQD